MAKSKSVHTRGGGGPPDRIDPHAQGSVINHVVQAIADADGAEPTDLDVTLYDYVEPEAVEALCRHFEAVGAADWEVTFRVDGYRVVVREDGVVVS